MSLPSRWGQLALLFVALLLLATYFGVFPPINRAIVSLANQPSVAGAFRDPISGWSDALITLLSFVLLTPLVTFGATVVVVLLLSAVMAFTEPMTRALRLPSWATVVPIGASGVGAAMLTKEYWLPKCLETLGFVARAYVVWSSRGF